jgi:serine/threonine protein kinase
MGVPSPPMETREPPQPVVVNSVQQCGTCQQRFSSDARFCPFDGDSLVPAVDYHPERDPLLGTVVDGRYEVVRVLGEGGMGTVYNVRHRALDKHFAMKVMRADLARQGDLAARFIQEARAAASIGHLNIVQITDFGQLSSRAPYFVMELLEGTSLAQMIRRGGPLPAGLAVRILQQVGSALAAAHAAGVIHRDLKPDNIHLSANNVVKILDFGVAKIAGAGRLTKAGMVFGTPHYMSPEQASGGDVDHRADIYALGIIMYEMFTGRVPFEADSYMGVLTKHMYMEPEPPSRVHAAAHELGALEDVTLKCLEKRPEARYESMEALVREIESLVRFSGEQMQILRPSSLRDRSLLRSSLADELEAPTRDELRAAALGNGTQNRAVFAGLLLVAVCIVLAGVAYQRQQNAATAPSVLVVPADPTASNGEPPTTQRDRGTESTQIAAPQPTQPELEPSAPIVASSSAAEPSHTLSISSARAPVARPRPPSSPIHKSAASAGAASSQPAIGLGVNDIVNPWAK